MVKKVELNEEAEIMRKLESVQKKVKGVWTVVGKIKTELSEKEKGWDNLKERVNKLNVDVLEIGKLRFELKGRD